MKHCNGDKYGSYSSLVDAELECSSDSGCKAVYVNSCKAEPGKVYLCPSQSVYETSSSSCIYQKPGNVYYFVLSKSKSIILDLNWDVQIQ